MKTVFETIYEMLVKDMPPKDAKEIALKVHMADCDERRLLKEKFNGGN